MTGQGELTFEPGHLDTEEWIARTAETPQHSDWHRMLLFRVGPTFQLYIGDNFRGAVEDGGVLRMQLDDAEVTVTDQVWALFGWDD